VGAESAYQALVDSGVDLITAVPDSLLAPLHRCAAERDDIAYIQVCDEATAVGIAAGARLAGSRSLVLMENSGLRRACETMARFALSHRLHTVLLLARRGAFGEANWWGLPHEETMHPHLRMLSAATAEVDSVHAFPDLLRRAYDTLDTGQRTVALIANPPFVEELRSR
jgi:sulfopyruvate decarboxylase TPP-binding subunit